MAIFVEKFLGELRKNGNKKRVYYGNLVTKNEFTTEIL